MKNSLLFLLFPVALAISCSSPSEKTSEVAELPILGERYVDDNQDTVYHSIADFAFVNQVGDTIRKEDMVGKIYVADFFFTTCGSICPKMTNNMALAQEAFVNDSRVMLLSHTVFPEIDSVAVLKQYAQEKGVDDRKWNLVTGDKKEIYSLARKAYLAVKLGKPSELYDMVHTENFVLVDNQKRVRGFYDGTKKEEIERLIADIHFLLDEELKQREN